MEQKYTVDARGEQCPIPVVRTKKVLDSVQGDAQITVLVDNETAVQNLTRMGKHAGAEVLSEKKSDREFQVIIHIKDRKPVEGVEETAECIPDVKGDFVIAVDTAIMGRGNDELGKVLMKGFIFAVTQLEKLPKTILFYNGGAVLTTEGSDSLADIKSLEAQGVEIKTCGTCLNYYGLTDKLQVGEVTNMYDIVETLAKASKVVKP
ncbi:MAG: sulfurtransferase-like selenium metabolism protein YedF [Eubacteriales bacterium]|nr:sulfurtransferase-like selenium metabolism protein YedF [Eubacteriales bacterium]